MSWLPATLRREVIDRADGRCEYCGLSQTGQVATFHIDHIVPVASGGLAEPKNLALACVSCSLRKAARQTARDPASGLEVPLFHPRFQIWSDHFQWEGVGLVGLTANGRATVELLRLNRSLMLSIRAEETLMGRHPPPRHWQQRQWTF